MGHPAQHVSQAVKKQKRALLVGTADAVFQRGTALVYNRDYGTAATREGSRDKRVEAITTSNAINFAGVLDHKVTLPSTGEAWVTINEPGSVCDIAIGSDVVVNATHLWPLAASGDPGRFRADEGVGIGRGCAKALQTNASGNLGESLDGSAVVSTKTLTKTALFADAVAGDIVVILAGCTAAGAAGSAPGRYVIDSVTSDNAVELVTAPGDGDVACFVISGNPVALAYLYDGEETGCIEWIDMLDNDAVTAMVGGCTHVMGGVTLGAGDCTDTLADGTFPGQKKGFVLHGALTTQDYLVTVTSGIQMDGSTGLGTFEMDADGDYLFVVWRKDEWQLVQYGGPTLG